MNYNLLFIYYSTIETSK